MGVVPSLWGPTQKRMGAAHSISVSAVSSSSSHCLSLSLSNYSNSRQNQTILIYSASTLHIKPNKSQKTRLKNTTFSSPPPRSLSLNSRNSDEITDTQMDSPAEVTVSVPHAASVSSALVGDLVYDALVWSALHGLVVGDKNVMVVKIQ